MTEQTDVNKHYDVYICSSRRDYTIVDRITNILYSENITYYRETLNFSIGEDSTQTRTLNITSSKIFLCVISNNSISSSYVMEKLNEAKKIINSSMILPLVTDSINSHCLSNILGNIKPCYLDANNELNMRNLIINEINNRIGKVNKSTNDSKTIVNVDRTNKQIFISYKRDDKDTVLKIKEEIEKYTNLSCWMDLDGIESDAQFANVIIKAINHSEVFLFMYSAKHIEITDFENDWTIKEINFAQKKKKRIVFVNIDRSQLSDWFELMFGTKQHVDALSNNAMAKLYRDLNHWLH